MPLEPHKAELIAGKPTCIYAQRSPRDFIELRACARLYRTDRSCQDRDDVRKDVHGHLPRAWRANPNVGKAS
jgi:hypothetical protein